MSHCSLAALHMRLDVNADGDIFGFRSILKILHFWY